MAQGATRKSRQRGQPENSQSQLRRLGQLLRLLSGTTLALAVAAAIGYSGWYALQIPVERIVVSGDLRQVARARLTESVNASLSGGFLWVDLQKIRASVEKLPWVYRVNIKRQWPNSLEIQVVEQLAIARWGDDAYLNHTGEVFEPGTLPGDKELALLAGPVGSQRLLMQHYNLIQDGLQPLGLQVEHLTMDKRGGLRAQLTGGSELIFGRGDVTAKMQRFAAVFRARLVHRAAQLRTIDLRYSHGVAVAWAEPAVAGNRST
jgi:cell division protein FtsQ